MRVCSLFSYIGGIDLAFQQAGFDIVWREANKDCKILVLHDGDVKKGPDSWTQYFDWFCKMGILLKKITAKYGN